MDKALEMKPDYWEAIITKGLLYRVKAKVARNPKERQEFLEQAETLQKQAMDLRKEQQAAQAGATDEPGPGRASGPRGPRGRSEVSPRPDGVPSGLGVRVAVEESRLPVRTESLAACRCFRAVRRRCSKRIVRKTPLPCSASGLVLTAACPRERSYGAPGTAPPACSIIFSEMMPMRSTPAPLATSIAWTTLP